MQLHLGQITRLITAGLFNTSLSYSIYALGLWLGLSYPVANFISMVVGVCVGLVTQGRFVFRRLELHRLLLFAFTWLIMWVLNIGLISIPMPLVESNAYVAGAVALVAMI